MSGLLRIPQSGFVFGGGGGSGGSGNTGVPLGPFANWAALPVSAETGALASVTSIGPGNATGVAIWSGAQWQLYSGVFDLVADMNAFAQPIMTGAVVAVEETGDNNENGVRYQYEGSWVRTAALTLGFAWALTDLSVTDPSLLGITQVGDFGRYTNPTSGAIEDYRLRNVTIDAAIGGGTLLTWVPTWLYGEAGVTLRGFLTGTETMPARGGAIQGYTVGGGGAGSVSSAAGEIVLTCTTATNFASLQSTYAVQPTDKVYIRQRLRLVQAAATNVTYFHLLYSGGTTQPQWVSTQNPTVSSGAMIPSTTGGVLVGSSLMVDPLSAVSAVTAELIEVMARSQTGMVTLRRNNLVCFAIRRNAQTGTATGQHLMQVLSGATGACTAYVSQHLFMTY